MYRTTRFMMTAAAVLATALMAGAPAAAQEPAGGMVEWPYVGADQAASKYSPLADVDASNVEQLEVAWTWEPNELPNQEFRTRPGSFEVMPLMIDNVVYVSTMYTRVVALDAETGEQLWAFDPEAWRTGPEGGPPGGFKHRGVAVWPATANRTAGAGGDMRIFINSRDSLYALNAADGSRIRSFGDDGRVLLTENFPNPVTHEMFDQTSPPVVFEDLVIVGSRVPDRIQQRFDTPGSVQAFDVRTGERRWVFYTVPQSNDAFGADTWEGGSWRFTGHANVWGLMSLDAERGLLYVPTSTPSSDYWGGRRLGANLFAESLVCLDARTGRREWHFQAVHHGLWDYDFTSAPNLMTLEVDGRTVDAVAEVSKQGFTYVFDRVTGEPVWPIEERPVDTETDVPGEMPYPTQPFPTKPPPFAAQGVSLDDANDLTPEIHRLAVEELRTYRLGPLFTPPSLRGTLQRPRVDGGANWGGRGVRPHHQPALRADVGRGVAQSGVRDRSRSSGRRRRLHEQLPARRLGRHLPRTGRLHPGGAEPAGADTARQAALCPSRLHRPRRRRHRLERAVRRGEPGHALASAAAGRRAARAARHAGRAGSAGHRRRTRVPRRRRPVSVCVRRRDRPGGEPRAHRVPHQRQPDDLPLSGGPAVHPDRHRRRSRRAARGVRPAGGVVPALMPSPIACIGGLVA